MTNRTIYDIEDLPDEVLEFILGFLPPYKDIHDCMTVCKRWRRCVLNVVKIRKRNLHRALSEFEVAWSSVNSAGANIVGRYSHSAAIHDNFMYVFGGRTNTMTTFNDLWKLDLSTRKWVRPLTQGEYPSPKASSSMICYNDMLILFGGWTYPPTFPVHQACMLFSELHSFHIPTNRWRKLHPCSLMPDGNGPPPMAGHSVTIHRNRMVVFGGLQRPTNLVHSAISNDVWVLNLFGGDQEDGGDPEKRAWQWIRMPVSCSGNIGSFGRNNDGSGGRPCERYGQSQVYINEDNLLVIGGSGSKTTFCGGIWRLDMTYDDDWRWISVDVRNPQEAPSNLWCNPVCRVDDKLIVFSRSRTTGRAPPITYYSKTIWRSVRDNQDHPENDRLPNRLLNDNEQERLLFENGNRRRIDMAHRQVDHDENVNGKRGTLKGGKRINENGKPMEARNEEALAGPSGSNDAAPINLPPPESNSIGNSEASSDAKVRKNPPPPVAPVRVAPGVGRNPYRWMANQSQRLAALNRAEENWKRRFAAASAGQPQQPPPQIQPKAKVPVAAAAAALPRIEDDEIVVVNKPKNVLGMYVLDISHLMDTEDPHVQWLPIKGENSINDGPEERVLYSLVPGKSELIMFGGIQMDPQRMIECSAMTNQISNLLHFITAPRYVI